MTQQIEIVRDSTEQEQGFSALHIDAHLKALRHLGIQIGVSEVSKVSSLILQLSMIGAQGRNYRELARLISPLLAKSEADQEVIASYFAGLAKQESRSSPYSEIEEPNNNGSKHPASQRKRAFLKIALIIILVLIPFSYIGYVLISSFLNVEEASQNINEGLTPFYALIAAIALSALFFVRRLLKPSERELKIIRRRSDYGSFDQDGIVNDNPVMAYSGQRRRFARANFSPFLSRLKIWRAYFHSIVDPVRTAREVAENFGVLRQIFYRSGFFEVEHFLFIDRRHSSDHTGAIGDIVYEKFDLANLRVRSWDYSHSPSVLYPRNTWIKSNMVSVMLSDILDETDGQFVIFVSNGEGFLDPIGGKVRGWLTELTHCSNVVLFSTKPAHQWGDYEARLRSCGVGVFAATREGIDDYIDTLAEGAATRLPEKRRTIRIRWPAFEIAQRYIDGPEPSSDEIGAMLFELESYLGSEAFIVLCALSCAPSPHPELTLFLGRRLIDDHGNPLLDEDRLSLISQLPWLRDGSLPSWLCVALAKRLPQQYFDATRYAISDFLADPSSMYIDDYSLLLGQDIREFRTSSVGISKNLKTYGPRAEIFEKLINSKDLLEFDYLLSGRGERSERSMSKYIGNALQFFLTCMLFIILYVFYENLNIQFDGVKFSSGLGIFDIVALSIIQGITEFLPISNSGHLALWPLLTGRPNQPSTMDIAVHIGTFTALSIFFRSELIHIVKGIGDVLKGQLASSEARFVFLLCIATIPAIVGGLILKLADIVSILRTLEVIAWATIAGALLMWLTDRWSVSRADAETWTLRDAILMGLAQAVALIPGISRSGICMTMARGLGFDRTQSARLAMLLAFPVILAAGAVETSGVIGNGDLVLGWELLGAATLSCLSALVSLSIMMRMFAATWTMLPFILYRLALGLVLLAIVYA